MATLTLPKRNIDRTLSFSSQIPYLSAITLLVWSTHAIAQNGAPADLAEVFRREAPPAWKKYKAHLDKIQGTLRGIDYAFIDGQKTPITNRTLTFSQAPGCFLYTAYGTVEVKKRKRTSFDAWVINNSYHFHLKSSGMADGWKLIEFNKNSDSLPKWTESHPRSKIQGILLAPISLGHSRVDDWPTLLGRSDTQITKVTEETQKNERLVLVEFTLNRKPSKDRPILVTGPGRVWFSRDSDWVMRRAEYSVLSTANSRMELKENFEYENDGNGIQLLKKSAILEFDPTKNQRLESVSEYSLNLKKPSEDAFLLKAFGLPEPVNDTPHQANHHWLWLRANALGHFCGAVTLRRWFAGTELVEELS